jgi:hypothetical protein
MRKKANTQVDWIAKLVRPHPPFDDLQDFAIEDHPMSSTHQQTDRTQHDPFGHFTASQCTGPARSIQQ